MTIVTLEDCKKLGYCNSGIRAIFNQYQWDWWDFLQNGIDEDTLLAKASDNALIIDVIQVAKDRENG